MRYLRQRYRETPMKFRSGYAAFQANGTPIGTPTFQDETLLTFSETFTDVAGSDDGVKPATHHTFRANPKARIGTIHVASGSYDSYSSKYYAIPDDHVSALAAGPSSPVKAGLADAAFNGLFPQVPQEVSIPNFLYELREIGSLVPNLSGNMLQNVSGGYLNYQFGWKPLIGDIQTILSLMGTIRTRLEYLKSTWGRETRISFSSEWEIPTRKDDTSFPGYRYNTSGRGIFRAGGYLYHELQDLDGLIGEFRALTAATGFNNPLGVIWEAIPFSFLVDWVGRVGSLISRTPIQPFVGPWEIHKLCHSFSWEVRIRGERKTGAGYVDRQTGTEWYPYTDVVCKRYVRDLGLPVSSSIFSTDSLSPQQQLLALALLGAASK